MVDPGFSTGGALSCWGAANLQCRCFSAKTYTKMKELDPVGGMCAGGAPLGSANGTGPLQPAISLKSVPYSKNKCQINKGIPI